MRANHTHHLALSFPGTLHALFPGLTCHQLCGARLLRFMLESRQHSLAVGPLPVSDSWRHYGTFSSWSIDVSLRTSAPPCSPPRKTVFWTPSTLRDDIALFDLFQHQRPVPSLALVGPASEGDRITFGCLTRDRRPQTRTTKQIIPLPAINTRCASSPKTWLSLIAIPPGSDCIRTPVSRFRISPLQLAPHVAARHSLS